MAVGPGLLAQVLEHGGRGGVADRAGVVGGQQRLDRDARHGRGRAGRSASGLAAGRRPWHPGPWPAARGAGCASARRGAGGPPSRRRAGAAAPSGLGQRVRCHPWSRARPGPVPAIGTQAGMPRERTTTPQCSPSGSAAFGPAGAISTQATRAASAGSAAWISVQRGDLGPPARRDPGRAWSGTHPARCWPARAGASSRRTAWPARPGRGPWAWFPPACRAVPARRSSRGVGFARRVRAAGPGGRPARRAGHGPGLPPAHCHASAG